MDEIADAALAPVLADRLTDHGLVFVARSEAQADRIAAALRVLSPQTSAVRLPAWDCLPYDRGSPTRGVMGRRMAALGRLSAPGPHLLLGSAASLAQRLPPPAAAARLTLQVGQILDPAALGADLLRLGYVAEAAAWQPGEYAPRSEVIDLFAAAATWPVRIRLDSAGIILAIDRFDPDTQRSRAAVERLQVGPASEAVFAEPQDRPPGIEHRLADLYPELCSVFDLLPDATVLLDAETDSHLGSWLAQVEEAREARVAVLRAGGGAIPPPGLYLDTAEWAAIRARAETIGPPQTTAVPRFADARDPLAACVAYVADRVRGRRRVGISGRRLARALHPWPGRLSTAGRTCSGRFRARSQRLPPDSRRASRPIVRGGGGVGGGGARGAVWLFTDPQRPPTPAAAKRLASLAAHDGLGAGFAIAAADLDLRGAGDLLGEEQAGHVKLLGLDLARHLLRRALQVAEGGAPGTDVVSELVLGVAAFIPADYVPDAVARIALYERLGRPHDAAALAEEIADRFGAPPEPMAHLLAVSELRDACRRLGIVRLEAGPEAVAAVLHQPAAAPDGLELLNGRLLLRQPSADAAQRLDAAWSLLHTVSGQGFRTRAA